AADPPRGEVVGPEAHDDIHVREPFAQIALRTAVVVRCAVGDLHVRLDEVGPSLVSRGRSLRGIDGQVGGRRRVRARPTCGDDQEYGDEEGERLHRGSTYHRCG